jgi:hypothetical protein
VPGHFVFPKAWIVPAIVAAVTAFGSLHHSPVRVIYRALDGESLGTTRAPRTIVIDKRGTTEWTRKKAQCVIAHEYGHLAGFRDPTNRGDPIHSADRRSIMYPVLTYQTCQRWLRRHGLD